MRVLGWANLITGAFECCACHDAHDEEEEAQKLNVIHDVASVKQPATALRACSYET